MVSYNLVQLAGLCLLIACGLAAGSIQDFADQLEVIEEALLQWRQSSNLDVKRSVSPMVQKRRDDALMTRPLRSALSPAILDALSIERMASSITWKDTRLMRLTPDGLLHAPFLSAPLNVGHSDGQALAGRVARALMRDVTAVLNDKDAVAQDLVQAILGTAVDVLALDFKQIFVDLVTPLMELVAEEYPIPEYFYSTEIMDGDVPMKYHTITQDNYGGTLNSNQSVLTYYPETIAGVQAIVRNAAAEGLRVRASGIKHSWNHWIWGVDTPMQPTEGTPVDYYIAMVPMERSDMLAHVREGLDEWRERAHELTAIEGPLRTWTDPDGKRKAAVRVGAATTAEFLFEWIMENKQWVLPAETLLLDVTYGGNTASISHGSGIGHKSIPDYVLAVEYVDAYGELRTIDDPELLKTAAASFGLVGIVVGLTLELEELTYTEWQHKKIQGPMEDYLPRPGTPIPEHVVELMKDNYYYELFSYPNIKDAGDGLPSLYQNVWTNNASSENAITLVTELDNDYMTVSAFLSDIIIKLFKSVLELYGLDDYLYWVWGYVFSIMSDHMNDMPEPVVTSVSEAMHFQRGLHALVVRAMEFNVGLADDGSGQPDWALVQAAWWGVHDLVAAYEQSGKFPVDTVIEMRLLGGSDMHLAPYQGNAHGTISIEICSSILVPFELWEEFKVDLATTWTRFTDSKGAPLLSRPHWGKEFPSHVGDLHIDEFIKSTFGAQVDAFFDTLRTIVEADGVSLADHQQRFSTKYLDYLFEDGWRSLGL